MEKCCNCDCDCNANMERCSDCGTWTDLYLNNQPMCEECMYSRVEYEGSYGDLFEYDDDEYDEYDEWEDEPTIEKMRRTNEDVGKPE